MGTVQVRCGNCKKLLSVVEAHVGRKLRCPTCKEVFIAAEAFSPQPALAADSDIGGFFDGEGEERGAAEPAPPARSAPRPQTARDGPPENENLESLRRKLRYTAGYLVQGRGAARRPEVMLRRVRLVLYAVFSVLAAVGLVPEKLSAFPDMVRDLGVVGAVAALLIAVAMRLYMAFGVEKRALHAINAKNEFSALEVETRRALEEENPLPGVSEKQKKANALAVVYHAVLAPAPPGEVNAQVQSWWGEYSAGWVRLPTSQQTTALPDVKEFTEGTLRARFVLDVEGRPLAGEEDGWKFYRVELALDTPRPQDIQKVTYTLDEDTYWEPERESTDRLNSFAEGITAYGDFLLRARVETARGTYTKEALLSELLRHAHGRQASADVSEAIAYIREPSY